GIATSAPRRTIALQNLFRRGGHALGSLTSASAPTSEIFSPARCRASAACAEPQLRTSEYCHGDWRRFQGGASRGAGYDALENVGVARRSGLMAVAKNPYDHGSRRLLRLAGLPLLCWLLRVDREQVSSARWLDTRLTVPGHPERVCDTVA